MLERKYINYNKIFQMKEAAIKEIKDASPISQGEITASNLVVYLYDMVTVI